MMWNSFPFTDAVQPCDEDYIDLHIRKSWQCQMQSSENLFICNLVCCAYIYIYINIFVQDLHMLRSRTSFGDVLCLHLRICLVVYFVLTTWWSTSYPHQNLLTNFVLNSEFVYGCDLMLTSTWLSTTSYFLE